MVDDGSTDGSTAIAKSFAARDARFRLVQQDNQGLGPARNTGTKHATGAYLAFFDSDDLLAPHAYEILVGSLEKTGSDMACGGVRRFSPAGIGPSPMHQRAVPVDGAAHARLPLPRADARLDCLEQGDPALVLGLLRPRVPARPVRGSPR